MSNKQLVFDVKYGLPAKYPWMPSSIMVPREFADKFHNPRHLPVKTLTVKYLHPNRWLDTQSVVVYEQQTSGNGYPINIPVKWWDKMKKVVEHFSTHSNAVRRHWELLSFGLSGDISFDESTNFWAVTYYEHKKKASARHPNAATRESDRAAVEAGYMSLDAYVRKWGDKK